ncbi:MAG: DUF4290 domain-containing protein [Cytophagales bacterium]
MHTYNTKKPNIRLRKYGRTLESLVQYIIGLKEKKQRQSYAEGLIYIMRSISQQNDANGEEPAQLWADLMAISDHKLVVDTPYPISQKTALKPYKQVISGQSVAFRCCGQLVSQLIKTTCQLLDQVEDPKGYLCYLIKIIQETHNNRSIKSILRHIEEVAGQKLPLPHEEIMKWGLEKPRSTGSNRPRRKRNSQQNR